MAGSGLLIRSRLRLDDALRKSRLPAWYAGLRFARSFLRSTPTSRLQASADYLMHRPSAALSPLALRRGAAFARIVQDGREVMEEAKIKRSVVAKPRVSTSEPGAILVSFEPELRKILALRRFDALQRDYRILFMPSWQNFFTPVVLRLDAAAHAPYYLLPSCFDERALRPMLGPHARFLPFHAASWVNHELYSGGGSKDIDIVMLANFQRFKRHWRLFEILANMDPGPRVRLLGVASGGRTRQSIEREAEVFGVLDRVEILDNADQKTIRDTLRRARLMCAMSHREGSYVGVAEALMADTPVAMFADAMIGTRAYINERTGFLLDPRGDVAEQLTEALARAHELMPRSWAVEHISAASNCTRLNEELKRDYLEDGLDWTEDVRSFHSIRFDFYYDDANAAAMDEDHARLARDYGLELARPELPADCDSTHCAKTSAPK